MPTVTIAANVSGNADQADKRAMLLVVNLENARRLAAVPPIAVLPTSTGAELKDSYQTVQTALLNAAHTDYVRQSDVATLSDVRALWEAATDAQRNAAKAALQT